MPLKRPPNVGSSIPAKVVVPWGQERRLEFIDFRLQWDGRLNRADLMEHFAISVPQASADIAKYAEKAPANLVYDRSARVYVSGQRFKAVYSASSAEHYLNDLLAESVGVLAPDASYLGWLPPTAIAESPSRLVSSEALSRVLQTIRQRLTLKTLYQSMSRTEPGRQALSSHAIGFDGHRWHVRAYCHELAEFRDFVVARMLEIEAGSPSSVDAADDVAWSTYVRLVLVPNPRLPKPLRKVIELDYGMHDGQVAMLCRQAMLSYVMRRLGLSSDGNIKPETQQIALKNIDEVRQFLSSPSAR